jgi:hypothetical protein
VEPDSEERGEQYKIKESLNKAEGDRGWKDKQPDLIVLMLLSDIINEKKAN